MSEEQGNEVPQTPEQKCEKVVIGKMEKEARHALYDEWKKQAKACTPDTVGDFIRKLVNGYCHDYDSIAVALSVAALAGAWAVEHAEQGGLTGFQWGWASHRAVEMMTYESSRFGIRIQDMDNLLYPQYADKFAFVKVDQVFAQNLREEAKRRLEKETSACDAVRAWWTLLAYGDFPTWLRVED